ncbi:ribosome maturation protein [Trichoderma cornu-damae]|uniref:Ribosome maturation protein n=1 Tax=Trichoderma cornu-damae TaxID=654480 RepID=A0A9P8QXY4_9HYPO|nr:ribosome maturation protein [Trichoderma cornu-damae]
MTRGESTQSNVHYKGKQEDFLVFVDDVDTYRKWLSDKSVPLAHFTSAFTVFVTHRRGVQGTYDSASKMELSAEFDTDNSDDVIERILQDGTLQNMEASHAQFPPGKPGLCMPGRQGSTNEHLNSMRVK